MPVPTPRKGETQEKFMGRCMRFMTTENDAKSKNAKRPQNQMVAICFNQWKDKSMASSEEASTEENPRELTQFVMDFLKRYPEYHEYFGVKLDG